MRRTVLIVFAMLSCVGCTLPGGGQTNAPSAPGESGTAQPTAGTAQPTAAPTAETVLASRATSYHGKKAKVDLNQVVVTGDVTTVTWNLNAKAATALDRAAQRLKDLGATKVRVAGYTDSKGSKSYNKSLSQRRAEAVRAGLAARLPGLRYSVKGYGESHPVATNETGHGRALNRRVTITVTG